MSIPEASERSQAGRQPPSRPSPGLLRLALVALLLAMAQMLAAGYTLGVGNQSIQIPFLRAVMHPELFAGDLMLGTRADYPTYFFSAVAVLLRVCDLPWLYAGLHLLTGAGVFAATYLLAQAFSPTRWASLLAMLLLVAGQQSGLAGDDLYSTGFTHTWAVFPVAIVVLWAMFTGRPLLAMGLAGVLFNVHALTATYLFAFCAAVFWRDATIPSRRRVLAVLLFGLLAAPTAVQILSRHQVFDEQWIYLTRIRSAEHVIASTLWESGNAEVPAFALIVALAGLAMSFPGRPGIDRRVYIVSAAAAVLLALGYLFSEVDPQPWVMRAQLFRATRLLVLIALVRIAGGAAAVWDEKVPADLSRWRVLLERWSCVLTLASLATPALDVLLPIALLLAVIVAIINGRLAWWQAIVAGGALLIWTAAVKQIDLPLPNWSVFGSVYAGALSLPPAFWLALIGAIGMMLLQRRGCLLNAMALSAGFLLTAALLAYLLPAWARVPDDPWIDAQRWAGRNTPETSLFLTPIKPGSFRIFSERPVVAEWRDGTQMFFSSSFGSQWWDRIKDLQPGIQYDPTGSRLLDPGSGLESLNDERLIRLAQKYHADYIVLPASSSRALTRVYGNTGWAIYRPEVPLALTPAGARQSRWQQQEKFMRDVVYPAIEKNRKMDVRIECVDAAGKPITDLPYRLKQTRSTFCFACSLPFFIDPPKDYAGEGWRPPPVTPVELERFLGLFNASSIPFSGKWMYIEQREGQQTFEDLDAYTRWCRDHAITAELHFLSGYPPPWVKTKSPEEQKQAFLRHALAMVNRYRSSIHFWQVTNEGILAQDAPDVIRAIRKIAPELKLGISDCARFYSTVHGQLRENDMLPGINAVRALKAQGTPVDFFSYHGHRPFGVWADPKDMYEGLDAFAREGVRVHISEFGIPVGKPILGDIREGTWTPELQADFYERVFTVCFSHPAVEMVNLWLIGPHSWQPGAGLLDETFSPKPVYERLNQLIHQRFHSEVSGKLPVDGAIHARVFAGDYTFEVRLPDGHTLTVKLQCPEGQSTVARFRIDRAAATMIPAGQS